MASSGRPGFPRRGRTAPRWVRGARALIVVRARAARRAARDPPEPAFRITPRPPGLPRPACLARASAQEVGYGAAGGVARGGEAGRAPRSMRRAGRGRGAGRRRCALARGQARRERRERAMG